MKDDLEAIRAANDIVSVVGQYVKLKKAGTHFIGLCPFHAEKRPSFSVHSGKQLYLCRSCGAGGDVFRFIQHIEGLGFRAAKELLAIRAGITVQPVTATERKAWAMAADERELVRHFGFVEGVSPERAGAAFHARHAGDSTYRDWLKEDFAQAYAITGALIAVLAFTQQREACS
jgi:hypothetical protein